EVRQVMGFSLEDFYDETKGDGEWRNKYKACIENEALSKRKVPAIDIMKRIMISQLESGTPFMFYRDEVNRRNNNPHKDRKSTRLNSSHVSISYAVFCLKKKNNIIKLL